MDEFSLSDQQTPKHGDCFDVGLSAYMSDDESWEKIFSGNPERKKCLEHISGWSYRGFGEIVAINPLQVDCGILVAEDVVHTQDSRMTGEFVAFSITRLDANAFN